MEKRMVTTYSVGFRGVFGRNRSSKYTSENPREVEGTIPTAVADLTGIKGVDVRKLAEDFGSKIGAKRGWLVVTRYDNTEDLGGGLYVVPITQGVEVIRLEVLAGRVEP